METPNGRSACSKGGVGCAFDNFDRKIGKDTLRDTVGISYELVFPDVSGSSEAENNDKNIQEKTADDSKTYPTTQSSEQVRSKTGNFELILIMKKIECQ